MRDEELTGRVEMLEREVHAGFERIDARFERLHDGINKRFQGVDARLDCVDARFERFEALIRTENAETRRPFGLLTANPLKSPADVSFRRCHDLWYTIDLPVT